MNKKYLSSILLIFIFNGGILASEIENENKNTKNTEITAKEYSDLLEMKYDDFQNLLVAAEVEISDPDVTFTKENQMKLVQFLQNLSNPEKKSGETECRKDEMLFCQSERRISDGRSGRNKAADNVICQCGPIQILSW
jgi:hypothetical protein